MSWFLLSVAIVVILIQRRKLATARHHALMLEASITVMAPDRARFRELWLEALRQKPPA